MKLQKRIQMSWAGNYVENRTPKNTFFRQVNKIIDWNAISKEIDKIYKKGQSVDGRPSYRGIVLFKMMLLQTWYNLSDPQAEEMVNDSLSSMRFCELEIEEDVPDHSTLSRFRKELVEKKVLDRLLRKINNQLKEKGVMITQGSAKIDASITDSQLYPKGKTEYEIASDRHEDERDDIDQQKEEETQSVIRKTKPGVDSEARWLKKGGKLHYGYKKHIAVDDDGLVEAVHTTTVSEHESQGLKSVLEKVPVEKRQEVFADKGYKVPDNDLLLKKARVKNRIQHKAYRNRPLSKWEKHFNKLISKQRWVVERTFGGMIRWFGAGLARYKGMEKVHAQHRM